PLSPYTTLFRSIKISSLLACEVVGVKCLFVIPFYGAQRQVSYAYVVAAFIGIFDNGIKTCQEHLFKFQLFQIGPTLERVFHTADKKRSEERRIGKVEC